MWIYIPEDPADAARARSDIVADGRLTFGAMGLLLVILDHAPEWWVSVVDLSRWAHDRRGDRAEDPDAVFSLLRELVAHGYVVPAKFDGDGGLVREAEVFAVPVIPGHGDKQQVVYVIGQAGSRIAKIGTTSNLRARLRAIQTGHPFRLGVLWSCPGGRRLESWLHDNFASQRLEGEWFDFHRADPALSVATAVEVARATGVE